ncbi:MFS general substrate transporter [Aspergillus taichungensis]|uniref:MFS general substrate transporter n=1 Tax=Aspergillus taichungensis TaxID=482145 RepID=A0A2J5I250_9EURO|nr:MFS general substrate transporter [Aspergillus taichungensis]
MVGKLSRVWGLGGDGSGEPPYFLQFRSSKAFICFVVVFAIFTDILLYGLTVPVTPTALHERVGLAKEDEQRWVSILLALYGGALLAFSPVAGYLADRFESRWWPLIAGLAALGASTALLCIGTHMGLWIAGRLFQGASAAVVWTVGCALLVDTVDKEELGQTLGYIGMGMTMGLMGGPLLGGVIYEHGGYYAVFGLAFAIVGLDIVLRIVMIEKKHAVKWTSRPSHEEWLEMRPPSAETDTFSRRSLSKAPREHVSRPFTAATAMTADTVNSVGAQSTFSKPILGGENTSTEPEPRKKPFFAIYTLLSSDRILVCIWTYFILSVVLTSLDSVLPLYVSETFHWGQTGQGLIFIPVTVPHLVDPIVGYINDKYGWLRRYMAAGFLFATVPVIVLFRLVTHNSAGQKVLMCALLALLGLCIAVVFPLVMVEVSYVVQEKEDQTPDIFGKGGAMALAYGILNSAFAAGTIVGPFFAGYIRQAAGWSTMAWALSVLSGFTAIPVLFYMGGFVLKPAKSGT